jgi:hypothetical protein
VYVESVNILSNATLTNGNLQLNASSIRYANAKSTFVASQFNNYCEVDITTRSGGSLIGIGVGDATANIALGAGNFTTYREVGEIRVYPGNVLAGTVASYTQGDVIGMAIDSTNVKFYKNGTLQGTYAHSLTGDYFAVGLAYNDSASTVIDFNFGQREFANPPGTIGATDYFNTVTYTGTGGTKAVSGAGFQPDLVWIKNRSRDGSSHVLVDAVRGATKALSSNSPNAEVTTNGTDDFRSFDSDGFTVGDSSNYFVNSIGDTHVAWCWKAGGTAAADNSGTIDANVSANQDAGFSIVSWSGTGSTGTLAHGLDAAPKFIIVKDRDAQTRWIVYHEDMGNAGYVRLDEPSGFASDSTVFNSTSPTSSLFTVGTSVNTNPSSGNDMLAYCWTEKTGVSKFGEYTGNGSSDGPVISCGFRPAMIIIKWYESVNTAESWHLYDNKRGGNPDNTILIPDATADEESPADRYIQFTSDGFQLKSSGQAINRSGAKYIFMAWAATFTGSDDFKSLNTANLPEPDIKDGSQYFDTVTYSGATSGTAGAGTTQTVTGLGFSPDLVWIKNRSNANSHGLFDQVRGAVNALRSDLTNAEGYNK